MDRKTIIQSTIISICFIGTGAVLYNGFSGSSAPAPAAGVSTTTSSVGEKLLPNGNKFEIDKVLGKHKLQFGKYSYPKLDFDLEVGKAENELVSPLPEKKP